MSSHPDHDPAAWDCECPDCRESEYIVTRYIEVKEKRVVTARDGHEAKELADLGEGEQLRREPTHRVHEEVRQLDDD